MAGVDSYAFRRDTSLYHRTKAGENNLGEDLLGGMGQLHFGWFGGWIVKIVYFLLGLGLTYLPASGVNIWLARRRDKGRPAPVWECLWGATVWGQPAGIAAAAIAALVAGTEGAAIAIWIAVSVLFWLLAIRIDAARLSRWGATATGALMVLAGAVHFTLRDGASSKASLHSESCWLIAIDLALSCTTTISRAGSI